jgi:hypothetical protein
VVEVMEKCYFASDQITNDEINEWLNKIDNMTHFEMAYLWRTAPCFPVFHSELPIFEHFDRRFRQFGGMTPDISKQVYAKIEQEAEERCKSWR